MTITDHDIASLILSLLGGQTLAPHSVSADVVAHAIGRGHQIEQTPAGVRLIRADLSCWRDVLELAARRNRSHIGRRTAVYRTTGSTNDACWAAAYTPDAHGMIVLADEQSSGRGRRGNAWHSPGGRAVLFSCLLQTSQSIEQLTLLAGLATAVTIEKTADLRAHIKWPNDVLIGGRKISGILVERRGAHTVIGIGINVLHSAHDFPEELRQRATSLYVATQTDFDRLRIAETLARQVDIWCAGAPPQNWLDEWKSRCEMLGQRVSLRSNGQLYQGTVADIDPQRGIVLRGDTGELHFLPAAVSTVMQE